MPEMPMTIAKILAAIHPDTSPVVSGRASCRRQILRELFAIINAIVEEDIMHDNDYIKTIKNVSIPLGEVLPARCRVYAPDGRLITDAPMQDGRSQFEEPVHFPAGGKIQIDFRKTTAPDIVFTLRQDIEHGG